MWSICRKPARPLLQPVGARSIAGNKGLQNLKFILNGGLVRAGLREVVNQHRNLYSENRAVGPSRGRLINCVSLISCGPASDNRDPLFASVIDNASSASRRHILSRASSTIKADNIFIPILVILFNCYSTICRGRNQGNHLT